MHKLSVLIVSLMSEWYHTTAFGKFTSKLLKKESYLRNINCANTLTTALCFPSVTCSICCLGGDVDVKSSHWWRRGDGKIISRCWGKVSSLWDLRQTRWAATPKQCWSKHVNIWSNETPAFGTKIPIYIFPRLPLKITRLCAWGST